MRKFLSFIICGILCLIATIACQEKDEEESPYTGYWRQVESKITGTIYSPDEIDATYISFQGDVMKRYTSESDKCEVTEELGYFVKDDRLWYDTGSRQFTRNETILLSGAYLTITAEDGDYDKYIRINELPLGRE